MHTYFRFWPVFLRNLLVWRKLAIPSLVANIAEPLMWLVAFGYGLGALVGEYSKVSRYFYATGFSGHGFLQGPAIGEILRDLYLGREPFISVSALSADRFERPNSLRPEYNIV